MNDFCTGFSKILVGRDGPLILGLTAITMLILGWKFLDRGYRAEGDGWKVFCPGATDDAENCIEKAVDVSEFDSE